MCPEARTLDFRGLLRIVVQSTDRQKEGLRQIDTIGKERYTKKERASQTTFATNIA
jgi:hypothetical protein